MKKLRWVIYGLAVCAWKGLQLFAGQPPHKRYLWADWFGWSDPALDPEWDRVFDPGDDRHDATNIIVEWVRLNPQRAAKTFCGLLALSIVAGIIF